MTDIKMNKPLIGDLIWGLLFIGITTLFIIPSTRGAIGNATLSYPYLLGFLKTSVLASMGEILVGRIKYKAYTINRQTVLKFIVWGFLGMSFVLVFPLFNEGVKALQGKSLLPSIASQTFLSKFVTALLTSTLMNLIFAPTFMILHRFTDFYIDKSVGTICQMKQISLSSVVESINWKFFFGFVVFKTIPLFWIPAHTITFLLPEEYRVLVAAYLSIALGIILSLSTVLAKKTDV